MGCLVAVVSAQRPFYAGSRPIGVPDLASRFGDDSSESASSRPEIGNRNGFGDGGTTIRIPIDARGDVNLVNRINQWPRENQPFWYINADHIEKHRNTRPQGTSSVSNYK